MQFNIDYSYLPAHMREGIKGYVEEGRPPGDFFKAVLLNKLIDAAMFADDINLHELHNYARFLYNAPRACWGSEEAINSWIEARQAERKTTHD